MPINISQKLIIDKIGITVEIGGKELYAQAVAQLYLMVIKQSNLLPGGKIIVIKDEYSTRLNYYPEYHSMKRNRRIAYVTIGTTKTLHRYFTLTLSPSKFQNGEFEHFKSVLESMLPKFNYAKLYHQSKVNYLELAVDNFSQKHHSFLPYRKYCTTSKIYKIGSSFLGTTYVGSKTTSLFFRIYDKNKERFDKGQPPYSNHGTHTRIEANMRRLGVAPANLNLIKSPFIKLKISDLEKAKLSSEDDEWQAFLAEGQQVGIPDALGKHSQKRKKYLSMLDDIPVWWWKPEQIWESLPIALEKLIP